MRLTTTRQVKGNDDKEAVYDPSRSSRLELAQQLAKTERRSVTAVIELALLEYAERHPLKDAGADRLTTDR